MNRNQLVWAFGAAAAVLISVSASAADKKTLPGHVPSSVHRQQSRGGLTSDKRLQLSIGLPLRNTETLTNLLQDLYNPKSPTFRQYLTPEEFTEQFGPTEQQYQEVIAFAEVNGFKIEGRHRNRVLLNASGTVADIEKAFGVMLNRFWYPEEVREFYAPSNEPSVDAGLPILDVSGLSDYARPRPMSRKARELPFQPNGTGSAGGAYIGNDFRAAYVPGTWLTGSNQIVGLLQFDGFYPSDISAYEAKAGLPTVPVEAVLLDGFSGTPTTGSSSGNSEVSLDIEMVISMAPRVAKILVYEGNPGNFMPNDPLNRMATDNLAKSLSCSWGWVGGPDATTDQILQQFAIQGQSFFQASGDNDAYTGGMALDQAALKTNPMDNPFATTVGGTVLTTTGPGGAWLSETVWNWGNNVGSGGGISTYYHIPGWQTNVSMITNLGSTTLRNVPDVALTADNVYIKYGNGSSEILGGTSCAAPLWAGLAALANEQSAFFGQPPIGFINPAIYALGKSSNYLTAIHDITTGNNIGANTPGKYYAVAGYDLCTGWGTPKGTNLINALAPAIYVPVIVSNSYTLLAESSSPANNVIDPGETVTVSFSLRNIGAAASSNFTAMLQAGPGVLAPSAPQNYGIIAPHGGSASQAFTFTAAGQCGSNIIANLLLLDGTNQLGSATFVLSLGKAIPAQTFTQNFDAVSSPVLPAGWTSAVVSGATASWTTTTASKDTAPNSAFCPNSASKGANALVSPIIPIVLSSAQLSFHHSYKFEKSGSINYDGGVLEIRIGTGAFVDVVSAGGSFLVGGYDGSITAGFDNPLRGRAAFIGSSSSWKTSTLTLPAAAAGQNVQFRWVCGADSGNSSSVIGWYVDSISLQDGTWNCNPIAADLAATLAVAPESLNAGQNLEYTVTVTNPGPQAASAVMVTNIVPPQTDFVSASPSCLYSNGILICAAGTLSANAATNFTIVLAPRAIGPVTNTVQVSTVTPDPNPTNDSAALVIIQTGVPPQITSQPLGQTLLIGSKAFLGVTASGTSPLAYQWFFNNTNALFGANSNDLTILDVQPSHAGSYFVVVTNFFGSITSAPATLRVLVPPAFDVSALSVLRDQTTVSFQSTVGLIYTLEYTRLLQPAEWVPILPQATGDGGPITLRDTNSIPIPESRFYRIRYE